MNNIINTPQISKKLIIPKYNSIPNLNPTKRRRKKRITPEYLKTTAYYKRRKNNNLASKLCRDRCILQKKNAKEHNLKVKKRNQLLKDEVTQLEHKLFLLKNKNMIINEVEEVEEVLTESENFTEMLYNLKH
tara:strand:- start:188 stop:583 length:396 start_codon:yes stop_codon:yes gene_type:complete